MEFSSTNATLPLWVQLPAAAVLILVLLAGLRMAATVSGRYVVFACWLRFMLSAFPTYTYREVTPGLSGNAIGSAGLFLLGIVLLPRRLLLSKAMIGAYAVIATALLSAIGNAAYKDAFEPLVKMGLFIAIALHCYEALRNGDPKRFGIAALLAFIPLILLQIVSVILNLPKDSEQVGSRSYIGGYNHEAPFSTALIALFTVAAISKQVPLRWRIPAALAATGGIILANYRTAILAMIPLLLYLLVAGLGKLFDPRMRPMVTSVAAALLLVSGLASLLTFERFSDLRTIAQLQGPLIKPPEQFSAAEGELLSGRAQLWSQYIYYWKDEANSVQTLVGFGPDSWLKYFEIYAHSTFADWLFEYGLLGLASIIVLFATGLVMALRSGANRGTLTAAHLSFLVLNFATMPMWLVEGLILYGLLWGYTMFYRGESAKVAPPVRRSPRLRAVPA